MILEISACCTVQSPNNFRGIFVSYFTKVTIFCFYDFDALFSDF
jgi:hypothetical protein